MVAAVDKASVASSLNPAYLAWSKFRRRKYDECVDLCTDLLLKNPFDKAIWLLKTQALTALTFLDDGDLEELGIADAIMDDSATAAAPRPGTSIQGGSASGSSSSNSFRPMSNGGRPTSGFMRPSTQSSGGVRPGTREGTAGGRSAVEAAMRKTGSRPGTSRPVTALGRHVRLGTASMRSEADGPFIDVERLDLRKYGARPALARALMDFLLYHDHNPRKALELGAEATKAVGYECWWWKQRLGKCFYLLGLYREAEAQLKSSQRSHECIDTALDLGKVYLRLDQPQNALDAYARALETFPCSTALLVAEARTHELLNDEATCLATYKKVLKVDPNNTEAIASLGAHYFYNDQPEVALRFYKRLLESTTASEQGNATVQSYASAALWNNVGLCCFYSSQYDMTLRCFENALALADDTVMGDVYYNISHVAIGVGDMALAYQCLKVTVAIDPSHGEAWNNLSVLEARKGNLSDAAQGMRTAQQGAPFAFEPCFNAALLASKAGDLGTGHAMAKLSQEIYPTHVDTKELLETLRKKLA